MLKPGPRGHRHTARLGALLGTATALFAVFATSSASPRRPPLRRRPQPRRPWCTRSISTKRPPRLSLPGTKRGVVSVGDVSVINDQLTTTKKSGGGYPVIGYAVGTCTYTRVSPDGQAKGSPYNNTLESCTVTGVLPQGSISADGIITTKSGAPQNATFAVAGGTGSFVGAQGTVKVTFGSSSTSSPSSCNKRSNCPVLVPCRPPLIGFDYGLPPATEERRVFVDELFEPVIGVRGEPVRS